MLCDVKGGMKWYTVPGMYDKKKFPALKCMGVKKKEQQLCGFVQKNMY